MDCRRSCSQAKFFDRTYRYAGPSLSNGLSNFVYPSRDSSRLLSIVWTLLNHFLPLRHLWLVKRIIQCLLLRDTVECFQVVLFCFSPFYSGLKRIIRCFVISSRYSGIFSGISLFFVFLFWFETNYSMFCYFSRYNGIFWGYTSLFFAFLSENLCHFWLKRIIRCLFFEIQ